MRKFSDVDCPACRGNGDRVQRPQERSCLERTAQVLRCRRCRGTGVI